MTPAPPWPLAAFATSLPGDLGAALATIAGLGFRHVDVVAEVERPAGHLEALADTELLVCCAALGRGLPPGHSLDAADVDVRRQTLRALEGQVADAARLGATAAYLVPGADAGETALACFAEGCALLADYAAGRMVRLCVEHVPGRALPSAARTLDWLEQIGHANLGLLLDVGHCLLSGEDAAAVVQRAAGRLAHVHLDDNDGAADLHWPLLTGRLTHGQLAEVLAALRGIGYRGGLSLELHGAADPAAALRDGKALVERLLLANGL
jgi:sugar phosphate isomerase/epimerase